MRTPDASERTPRARYERWVRELTALGHRGSGTAHERAAAEYLCRELRCLGLEPTREPFRGRTSFAAALLLPVLVAAAGLALLPWVPRVTALTGALALLSLIAEQTACTMRLSRLLPGAASQNVFARIAARSGSPRARLVLVAHYDTQRTGLFWRALAASRLWGCGPASLPSPFSPVTAALGLQLLVGGIAAGRGMTPALSWGAGALSVIYGIAALLLGDWARGAFVPGASDNASGVAAVLSLTEAWLEAPADDSELCLLFTGCEEAGLLGAAAWRDRGGREKTAPPSLFLNLDGLGFGPPRFLASEQPLVGPRRPYPADLIALATREAAAARLADAGPHVVLGPTDGLALLAGGWRGLTLVGFQEGGFLPHYHLPSDTPEPMDFDAAWRGVRFAHRLMRRLIQPRDDGE